MEGTSNLSLYMHHVSGSIDVLGEDTHMCKRPYEYCINSTIYRALGSKLIGDQEFCMQIDAHMDFEDGWDKKLMDMWGMN